MPKGNDTLTADLRVAFAVFGVALCGCAPPAKDAGIAADWPDQNLRRQVFMECLEKAPAGPQATKYNDWDEVVEACGQQAYYISLPKPGDKK